MNTVNKLTKNACYNALMRCSRIIISQRTVKTKNVQSESDDMPIEMEDPYKPLPKRCNLCGVRIDYKNVQLLSQYVSGYTGMIHGIYDTGLCDKKYNELRTMIEHSRRSGYMPTMHKDPAFMFHANNIPRHPHHKKVTEYGGHTDNEPTQE